MYRDSLSPVQQVDFAFYLIFGFCFAVLLILTICACWFVWRYHHTRHPRAVNIKGNPLAEAIWTLVPSLAVMGLFYYGWVGYRALRTVPADALEVLVTARMWSWSFTYPNGKCSNELVVPVDKPVKLILETKDVIHSFFAPAFRIKMDTVPGMRTYAWFNAQRTGEYDVFCAEYCGDRHATMLATIRVVSADDCETWLEERGTGPDAGRELMEAQGCFACHSVDGSPGVGPTFKGIFGHTVTILENGNRKQAVVNREYFIESLVAPGAKITEGYEDTMPPYADFSEEQINSMIDYVQSLPGDGSGDHRGHP